MEIHVDVERVMELAEECMFGCTNMGVCLNCGYEQAGCEPDARGYECEECGESTVYGAEEALLMAL